MMPDVVIDFKSFHPQVDNLVAELRGYEMKSVYCEAWPKQYTTGSQEQCCVIFTSVLFDRRWRYCDRI